MNTLKTHLEKNGRSACGKSAPVRNSFVSGSLFEQAKIKCKKCALIFTLALTACDIKPMANKDIVEQVKLCTDAGLAAHEITTEYYMSQIVAIQCGVKR